MFCQKCGRETASQPGYCGDCGGATENDMGRSPALDFATRIHDCATKSNIKFARPGDARMSHGIREGFLLSAFVLGLSASLSTPVRSQQAGDQIASRMRGDFESKDASANLYQISLPADAVSEAQPEGGTSANCPGFSNPVVPAACAGEFRHGALVKKIGSGKNEILELAHGPEDATDTHPGLDLVADCGSPIYALADGVVVDVIADSSDRDFPFLGYMVRLKHAATSTGRKLPDLPVHETETIYLHMQEPPLAKLGTIVLQHTLLGKVGRTGAAWGCHSHFEIRHFRGRYMSDPSWNSPPNIYGTGDQTKSKLFTSNWTDPMSWLQQLPAELAPANPFSLDTAIGATVRDVPNPPTTFFDPGACPGEYCRYGKWTISAATAVHPSKDASTTLFTLSKGQAVTALTGVVITKPGKIRIIHPIRISNLGAVTESGEIYILTYKGEGFWKIWMRGKLIDGVQIGGYNFPLTLNCKPSDQACKNKTEAQGIGPIVGEVEEEPQVKWWVQIRDAAGRTGWIEASTLTWSGIYGIF